MELFEAMPDRGIEPNVLTINAVIEALDQACQFEKAMEVLVKGQWRGFDSLWKTQSKVDLHNCPAAVARTVVRCLLRDLSSGKREACEITVVTGRGKHSVTSAVLPMEIRSFLISISGPNILEVPENQGRFVITKESIEKWLTTYEALE